MKKIAFILLLGLFAIIAAPMFASVEKEPGYRGIWYHIRLRDVEGFPYKYSGGLGTYTANHSPIAVYSPEVNKTFFVYGGSKPLDEPRRLLMTISYYDHETGMVPRPTNIKEKGTNDAHHNPSLTIDKDGYLWVFMSAHGRDDGFIYKSNKPYSIEDGFEQIMQREFTYPQVWYSDDFGFTFLFTKYTRGRESYVSTSKDGINWSEDRKIAGFGGHYQSSWMQNNKIGTSFNWHPPVGGLDARTNLYYMETTDFGETWTNAAGEVLETPLSEPINGALVREYQKEGWLVYVNDVTFDKNDRPVIFYTLGRGFQSGPMHGERMMRTAHWNGNEWEFSEVTKTDHNYDCGAVYVEDDGTWRIIAPTFGPQAWNTGGEVKMFVSENKGKTWTKVADLTKDSEFNHTYVRKVQNAHPDFYAYWADGHGLQPSISRLYFANKEGDRVWRLPYTMFRDYQMPNRAK